MGIYKQQPVFAAKIFPSINPWILSVLKSEPFSLWENGSFYEQPGNGLFVTSHVDVIKFLDKLSGNRENLSSSLDCPLTG